MNNKDHVGNDTALTFFAILKPNMHKNTQKNLEKCEIFCFIYDFFSPTYFCSSSNIDPSYCTCALRNILYYWFTPERGVLKSLKCLLEMLPQLMVKTVASRTRRKNTSTSSQNQSDTPNSLTISGNVRAFKMVYPISLISVFFHKYCLEN